MTLNCALAVVLVLARDYDTLHNSLPYLEKTKIRSLGYEGTVWLGVPRFLGHEPATHFQLWYCFLVGLRPLSALSK